ncbi:uncharacterized protein LOC126828208 isoform X1 [Patella vulgata]|uniref:uncharacterized protein LOC126828208 isoform X1 n=1 Tax=Patella vulgata TaxID=6465 RepID=UPI0024A9A830|nr:uncharacterized protein LOC126828208 isoform X1 [Patella vulgata]
MKLFMLCLCLYLVESRRIPCQISKNTTIKFRLIAESRKKCEGRQTKGSIAINEIVLNKNKLKLEWNHRYFDGFARCQFLVQIKRKMENSQHRSVTCFRVCVIGAKRFRNATRKRKIPVQLSCFKRYLKREGIISVFKIKGKRYQPKLIRQIGYKFEKIPEPCINYEPKIRCREIDNGVNVSSCPRRFGRVEFGLYNTKTNSMEEPLIEPLENCWAFFPNITYGEYRGTVQILSCRDCADYRLTGKACDTTRYRSVPFIVGTPPTTVEPPTWTEKVSTPEFDQFIHRPIVIVICGIFAFLVFTLLLILLLSSLGKGCLNKNKNLEDALPLIPREDDNNNKMLVLYAPDHDSHFNAVKSFCRLMTYLGKDVQQMTPAEELNLVTNPDYGVVIVILSNGFFGNCKSENCLRHLSTLNNNSIVLFVSFGYGKEYLSDFFQFLAIDHNRVFSLTKEMDYKSNLQISNSPKRIKRELNLHPLLKSINGPVLDADATESIHESEHAQNFLFHVNRVMDSEIRKPLRFL